MNSLSLRVLWTSTCRERCLAALEAAPGAVLRFRGVLVRSGRALEVLLAESDPAKPGAAPSGDVAVRVFRPPAALRRVSHHYWVAFDRSWYEEPTLDVALDGPMGGSAALLHRRQVHRVHQVRVVGGADQAWIPGAPDPSAETLRAGLAVPPEGRHSRYAGALGGIGILRRLQRMTALVVGDRVFAERLADDLRRSGLAVAQCSEGGSFHPREPRPVELLACVGSAMLPAAAEWANRFLRPLLAIRRADLQDGFPRMAINLHLPGSTPGCPACRRGPATGAVTEPPVPLIYAALGSAVTLLERHVAQGTDRSLGLEWSLGTGGALATRSTPEPPHSPCRACRALGWGSLPPKEDSSCNRNPPNPLTWVNPAPEALG